MIDNILTLNSKYYICVKKNNKLKNDFNKNYISLII